MLDPALKVMQVGSEMCWGVFPLAVDQPRSQCTPKLLTLSKDPLAAAKEKEGAPEDAGEDALLGPLWSPSGMAIPGTLFSTRAGRQDMTALRTALGEDTAATTHLEGAGPPGPPPALPEPKGALSSPCSGCREQETQQRSGEDDRHDGSASLVWAATPGMLFQEDKQTRLHPLVSISGHGATMMVHTAPGTPAQLSPITPETFCGFFVPAAKCQGQKLCLFPAEPVLGVGLQQQPGRAQPDGQGGLGAPVRLFPHSGHP